MLLHDPRESVTCGLGSCCSRAARKNLEFQVAIGTKNKPAT